ARTHPRPTQPLPLLHADLRRVPPLLPAAPAFTSCANSPILPASRLVGNTSHVLTLSVRPNRSCVVIVHDSREGIMNAVLRRYSTRLLTAALLGQGVLGLSRATADDRKTLTPYVQIPMDEPAADSAKPVPADPSAPPPV